MSITIELPDEIAQQLENAWGNVSRRALEALAVEGYRSGDFSAGSSGRTARSFTLGNLKVLKEAGG